MKRLFKTVCLSLCLLLCASCGSSQAVDGDALLKEKGNPDMIQFSEMKDGEQIAVIETNYGDIKLRFFPENAPKAVENFLTLAQEGYYDNTIFHRVIADFMIQGGDPTGTGYGGESKWGEPFSNEVSLNLFHFYGALSMANSGGTNSNGSQFFIVQNHSVDENILSQMEAGGWPKDAVEQYRKIGGTYWLDMKHTVFGQVFEGMDTVEKIAKVKTNASDKPAEDVVIRKVTVSEYKK